jgi:hypothetical protein
MANPYKIYDRNQGPGWLKGLAKYVGLNTSNLEARAKDTAATIRNQGGDAQAINEASYVPKGKKKGK